MTFPFRRSGRPRFNGSPSDHAPTEQWLSQLRTGEADGTTWPADAEPGHVTFGGASETGLQPYEQAETGILYEDAQPAPRAEPVTRLRAQPRYQPQPPPPGGYSATTGPMPAIGRLAPAIGDALTRDETWGPKLTPLPCGHCGTPPPVPGDILERTKIIGHVNWLALKAGWIVDNDWIWTCPVCQQGEAWKARQGTLAARPPRDTPPPPGCEWHLGYRGVPCTCPPTHCDRHDGIPAPGITLDEYQCTCPSAVLATDVMLTSHDYLRTGRAISIRILRDTQAGAR